MKKLMIWVVALILLAGMSLAVSDLDIPLPTALGDSYGTFTQGEPMKLIQTCTNLTHPCDGCNLTSLRYPNGSTIVPPGGYGTMTKVGTFFNYTLAKAYTRSTGKYAVTGVCIGGKTLSSWAYTFEITADGFEQKDKTDTMIILSLFGALFIIVGLVMLLRRNNGT